MTLWYTGDELISKYGWTGRRICDHCKVEITDEFAIPKRSYYGIGKCQESILHKGWCQKNHKTMEGDTEYFNILLLEEAPKNSNFIPIKPPSIIRT